jgi:Mrp family chromosome partitioning ATPase
MDLLAYFRVLRRHWRLIVAVTVIGAALGAASTLLDRETSSNKVYYRATHTLVFDEGGNGQRRYTNPNQIASIATTGEVPDEVAKTLGTTASGRQLATRITTTNNPESQTLDVTAIDSDAKRAILLADTFADQLVQTLTDKEQQEFTTTLNSLSERVSSAQAERDAVLPRLQANPNDRFVQSEYQAAANTYGAVLEEYNRRANAGAPTAAVSTFEPAQAFPISSNEYNALLAAGARGRNHFSSAGGGENQLVAATGGSSFDDPVSRGVLGGILGFLAGIGLALVAHKLDRRIRTRQEAEVAFGLPVLAEVPKLSPSQQRQHDVVAVSAPLSRAAEAYRAIRTSLVFQHNAAAHDHGPAPAHGGNGSAASDHAAIFEPEQQSPLVVMVTSASPGEGKTTTSANLAAVFGEAGSSVLVLNCDFRRPSIHEMFGLADEPRRVQDTNVAGVKVVTNVLVDAGANPAQVVSAQRQVIAAARERFDVVVLDTAPLLTANDAIEVVSSADLVLLVARPELTTTDTAERSMDLLGRLDAPLGGVVLVAAADVTDDYYYYYQRGRMAEPATRGTSPATNGQAGDFVLAEPETRDEPRAR